MAEKKLQISHSQVQKSVEALLRIAQEKSDSVALIKQADNIHLQFCVKKIPLYKEKIIRLKLPNGLDMNREVCLFVKDLDRRDREYEKTVRHFKQKLNAEGIRYVSQVIPLMALKLEYKPYEAKRKLSNSFDIFLADARIIRLLPSYLGKAFYGRKRFPIQVHMDSKDLKEEFETAISNSRCIFSGKGSAGMATLGNTDMSVAELVQNIVACADQISAAIPGGGINIRSMYIKTDTSVGVPIYVSLGSANDVELPAEDKQMEPSVVDEVTTVAEGLVKVYPSGKVKLVDQDGKVAKALAKAKKRPLKRAGMRIKGVGCSEGKRVKKAGKSRSEKDKESAKSRPNKDMTKLRSDKNVKSANKTKAKQTNKDVKRAGKRKE